MTEQGRPEDLVAEMLRASLVDDPAVLSDPAWHYRDMSAPLSSEWMLDMLRAIGPSNFKFLAYTRSEQPDRVYWRGQLVISDAGLERLVEFRDELRGRVATTAVVSAAVEEHLRKV